MGLVAVSTGVRFGLKGDQHDVEHQDERRRVEAMGEAHWVDGTFSRVCGYRHQAWRMGHRGSKGRTEAKERLTTEPVVPRMQRMGTVSDVDSSSGRADVCSLSPLAAAFARPLEESTALPEPDNGSPEFQELIGVLKEVEEGLDALAIRGATIAGHFPSLPDTPKPIGLGFAEALAKTMRSKDTEYSATAVHFR